MSLLKLARDAETLRTFLRENGLTRAAELPIDARSARHVVEANPTEFITSLDGYNLFEIASISMIEDGIAQTQSRIDKLTAKVAAMTRALDAKREAA